MPENNPVISVIVPVYNVEPYLCQCLDSLLAQDFDDWEAILVDDGSTDGSGAVCDEYATADSRFRVIHQANGGVANARNAALTEAVGEYICFVDPDDWIDSWFFAQMLQAAEDSKCDIVVTGFIYEHPDRSIPSKSHFPTRTFGIDEFSTLLCKDKEFQNYMWNKLFHRKLITLVPEGIRYFEDMYNLIEWVRKADKVLFLSECRGYHYRQRNTSILGNKQPVKCEAFFAAAIHRLATTMESIRIENMTPVMARNCVYGALRMMTHIARGNLLPANADTANSMLRNMVWEIASIAKPVFLKAILTDERLPLKIMFRFRLALLSPTLFVKWVRLVRLTHRRKNVEQKKFD